MIFLDTSFIVAYANARDQHHARAVEIAKDIDNGAYGTRVVSEYILDESMTVLLSRTKNLSLAVSAGKELRKLFFIKSDEILLERTWEMFSAQDKPHISFTDCSTLLICERERVTELATFDENLAKKSGLKIIN